MHNTHEILGIIAGILALAGYVPYIYSTIHGSTRPNKASWIIWTLVGGLLAFSYIAEGEMSTAWVPLSYFLGPLIVAILSFRYGYSEWTKLDKICVVAAIISLIPWLLSKNASLTLIINLVIDGAGAIPTLVKSWHEPETEDFTAWFIFFIANTLEVIAIQDWWNIAVLYPIYLFFLAGSISVFILKGKLGLSKKH